jgi:hypothetical protein
MVILLALGGSHVALAANSGIVAEVPVVGEFYRSYVTQYPGVTWTFTTSNLSAGADTVIHVQNYDDPQMGFIAGNDDYSGLASQVVVPPAAATRNLLVIVRAYSAASAGTCTFTATPSSGTGNTVNIDFAGQKQYVGDLQLGAHVSTVEELGGAGDTVMLTVLGYPSYHAVAYNDDSGVGLMSWVHNNEACPGCSVIVANYSYVSTANTKIVWDDDADSTDYDNDGVGATYEVLAGTDPNIADSDQDGFSDGQELYGLESSGVPVKLATWGATMNAKDVFYEFDWIKCVNITDPSKCPQGSESGQMGSGLIDSDLYSTVVAKIQNDLSGLQVHMDIGRANTNASYWTYWGNWGGAERYDSDIGTGCGAQGASSWRTYLFHHALSYPWEDEGCPNCNFGHTCWWPGPFISVGVNEPRVITHESGHGFGLLHGARPFTTNVNHKSNYPSIMNYEYENWAPSFSHGTLPSLNPTSLSEATGLGAGAASIVLSNGNSILKQIRDVWCPISAYNPSGNCVNLSTGAVDWNRDGVVAASGNVQGPVQVDSFSHEAETMFYPTTMMGGHGLIRDPQLSWVTVGAPAGSYLSIFGRDESNRLVWARQTASSLNAGCAGPFSSFSEGTPDCAGMGDTTNHYGFTTQVPGPITVTVGPGAAEYDANKIFVVYQPTSGSITGKVVTISSSGAITYGGGVTVSGNYTAVGDITAINTGSGSTKQVTVLAPVVLSGATKLLLFRYTNGGWEPAVVAQKWSEDSTDINPMYGVGATIGYQDNSATAQVYAAIPTNPSGLVEFARQLNGGPYWSRVTFTCTSGSFGCVSGVASSWAGIGGKGLPTDSPPGTQARAGARPGLAYQKTAGQANAYVGRFYMMVNQPANGCSGPFGSPDLSTHGCEPRLIMTEGNVATGTPSSRRITWITPAQSVGPPLVGLGGMSLIDDVTRDVNLRGVMAAQDGYGVSQELFMPLTDGIMNATMTDMDDFAYISGDSNPRAISALRASLCLDGGSWPTSTTGFGLNICPLPPGLP